VNNARWVELPGRFQHSRFDISPDGSELVFERVEVNSRVAPDRAQP